ncbi:MAG: DegT/DnrJ/EryC1/StrS family aminotransferase [Planctomycetota bacterium]
MSANALPPVPFIDLGEQYAAIRDEVRAAVDAVFESQMFVLGRTVEDFERGLAGWMGLEGEVIGVSSGTDALLCALMAVGVGPGDRVLTTPFSFFATAGVIARLGARPVFVDIDPRTYAIDAARLADHDPRDYKALVAVHLYGRTADIAAMRAWADPAGLPVIEDAAQAIGATDGHGRPAGSLGTIGCFSFFPTKNLGAAGDAGCMTTTDPAMAADLRRLRVHGATRQYESEVIGGNFRIDALQAAVLSAKLPHLKDWTAARLENARAYDAALAAAGLREVLSLPEVSDDGTFIAHQYVIRSSRREALIEHLKAQGIGSAIYYPLPFHLMGCFANLGHAAGDFPVAEAAAREVLALPIFPELGAERRGRVIEALLAFDHA